MANHDECTYCHGVKGSADLKSMIILDPASLSGSVSYVEATHHMNGSITMNDDSNANGTDDANYNPTNGGCDNAICHGNLEVDSVLREGVAADLAPEMMVGVMEETYDSMLSQLEQAAGATSQG